MKGIVFDIGGTLMEYRGMPLSWAEFYETAFRHIAQTYRCPVSDEMIRESVSILKGFNPRLHYREVEISPRQIFGEAVKGWGLAVPLEEIISAFFEGLNLTAVIYEETIPVLTELKSLGYPIGAFTDLPTGMPDSLFKRDLGALLQYFDLYVSSLSCGYRKPNPQGLMVIAESLKIPTKELLFVGDEEKDRKTALNAGCAFAPIIRKPEGKEPSHGLNQLLLQIKTGAWDK